MGRGRSVAHSGSSYRSPSSRLHLGSMTTDARGTTLLVEPMSDTYVHGYRSRENERLQDQAGTLVDLLPSDTAYPPASTVLEAGCGVGAQTVTLAQRSPDARFTSIDLSADSLAEAKRRADSAGLTHAEFQQRH